MKLYFIGSQRTLNPSVSVSITVLHPPHACHLSLLLSSGSLSYYCHSLTQTSSPLCLLSSVFSCYRTRPNPPSSLCQQLLEETPKITLKSNRAKADPLAAAPSLFLLHPASPLSLLSAGLSFLRSGRPSLRLPDLTCL